LRRQREDRDHNELGYPALLRDFIADCAQKLRTCPDADLPKVRAVWLAALELSEALPNALEALERLDAEDRAEKSDIVIPT